ARLAGPGEAGDADQAVPRQPDGDVLEIVLAGAVDYELVGGHLRRPLYRANTCSTRATPREIARARRALPAGAPPGSRGRPRRSFRTGGGARGATGRPRR